MNAKDILKQYTNNLSDDELDQLITKIEQSLSRDVSHNDDTIVIVANQGVHAFDENLFPPGEVFFASEGSIGGSPMTADKLNDDLEAVVKAVASKLKTHHYANVFLVPSGLPVISLMIIATVIQVNAKPPVLLQYNRDDNNYITVDLPIRDLVVAS